MKIARYLFCLAVLLMAKHTFAQVNPFGAQFYFNNYIANPAYAGLEKGWNISSGLKAQWTNIDGAPEMGFLTVDHGSENGRVGLGLNFKGESLGLLRRTDIKASYAYHLKLDAASESFLDFGLSAGLMNEWLSLEKLQGDPTDQSLAKFNDRKLYLDADFGMAYRMKKLTIQASIPNMKRFFSRDLQRNVVDRSLFMAALSYNIKFENKIISSIEPKAVYRSIENFGDIYDVGANFLLYDSKLILNSIYHSTNSVSFGVGTNYRKLSILCMYTSNTSDLSGYSNGEYELGLKYAFK